MTEISLNKIIKNFGFKNVLNEFNLEIKSKEKIGLIGTNGCGKTTVLNIISGIETPETGQISIRKGATIGFLTQLPKYNDETAREVLYKGVQKELELQAKLNAYEQKLTTANEKELDKTIKTYLRLQDEFSRIGGYELETKIGKLLNSFKISKEMLDKKITTLSGGEKTMIHFASIILSNPDILLLDEPTNYLDIEKMEWLEEYLASYNGVLIVVSHDRYFLDKVTTKTVLIERGKAEIFSGNYSYFLKENENRIMLEFKDYNNQQKQIDAMKKAIKRLREWGKQGDNEALFKRANAIEKRLEKLELVDKPLKKEQIPLSFDINTRSGKDALIIKDFSFAFGNRLIFDKVSLNIQYGEKICLIGNNGSGKTTLIKKIIASDNDCIKIGTSAIIGYIPQELNFEDENITVIDEARKFFSGQEHHLRSALCKFLFFEDNVFKRLKYLSGGEKVRLKLFCLIQNKCNLLIMDEPTNHIDVDTKEVLENALHDFKGTLLFISHDRYFINKLAEKILSIENQKIKMYLGNYDYYKEKSKQN